MAVHNRAGRVALLSAVLVATVVGVQRWRRTGAESPIVAGAARDDRPSPIAGADRVPLSALHTVSATQPAEPEREQVAEAGAHVRARSGASGEWAIIAATYKAFGAAAARASALRSQFAECSCSVFPLEGEGEKYYVVIGSGMARDVAELFRQRAVDAGLPPDTYVTKLGAGESIER
jgi:hypothetical protein